MYDFRKTISRLKEEKRYRSLELPHGIDLTSNDYLGMAQHPALREAAIGALQDGLNIGAAGSRLLRGHTAAHESLEIFATKFFRAGGALFFSSGFQANYAILTGLPGRGDVVLYDALVHASMRDGLQASHAKSFKFAHNDLGVLEDLLKRHSKAAKNIWIAVESVYSMDGDSAPLHEIFTLAQTYNAMLIIDEAHGTGVLGEGGRGLSADIIKRYGHDRIITLHTCGKAIGVAGGLVCASKDVIEYMINTSRAFIYTTAPMPLQALLVKKSLQILSSDDGDARRAKLREVCEVAHIFFGGYKSHIVPIIIGENERTLLIAKDLQRNGYDIRAIRPPTVPEGSARLRLSLSSELKKQDLRDFAAQYSWINKH